VDRQRHAGAPAPFGRAGLEPAPVGGDDRELGRDEEGGGQDQQRDGTEAERRSYGRPRFVTLRP
jgi:hypothetical protein